MKKLAFVVAGLIAGLAIVGAGTVTNVGSAELEVSSNTPSWTAPTTNDVVYVAGSVKKPGEYPWTNGMTFKDAVGAAGGFSEFEPTRLKLRHRDGTVDAFKIKKADPFKHNPKLKSGDYVGCLRVE
jgi:hypothetical protein